MEVEHVRSCDRILLLLHAYASNASIAAQETKASEADNNSSTTTAAAAPAGSPSTAAAASPQCFHLCTVVEPTTSTPGQTSITPTSSLLPVVPIHQS